MRRVRGGAFGAISSGSLLIAAAAALLFAGGATAAPSGLQESGGFFTASPAQTLSYGEAQDYWTPERIANAAPLELAADGSSASAASRPELFAASAEPFKSVEINKPASYPNRVHGKLVGTFPGLGDYTCSATVVTSGSGSLLTTAGHCAYDVASRTAASFLAFAPGYSSGSLPYGVWGVTNLILNKQWVKRGALDYDFSMLRTGPGPAGTLQSYVGSRGIGFNQPRKQRLEAYGYPAKGNPSYDGNKLIRCDGGYIGDPVKNGGPQGRGMRCDQQQGSSGGGWVSQHSFVVSNTSHGYPQLSNSVFFGPYYGAVARSMYKANTASWPTIVPPKCNGTVPDIVGTNGDERIHGTSSGDTIATLGGNDIVKGGGGKDVICAGLGNDKISGGEGKDRIEGGQGTDKCGKSKGGNKLDGCEGGGGKKK